MCICVYVNTYLYIYIMLPVRRVMGVCPQFDTLWANLTAREHLQLFAAIKGVQKQAIAGISVCCSVLQCVQCVAALRRHQRRAEISHCWY